MTKTSFPILLHLGHGARAADVRAVAHGRAAAAATTDQTRWQHVVFNKPGALTYQRMTLDQVDLNEFTLCNRGFHRVQEHPFFR